MLGKKQNEPVQVPSLKHHHSPVFEEQERQFPVQRHALKEIKR